MKKKLLYITDQEEYSEHGSIVSLFHGYLKNYYDVNVVYFTKYKNSFQKKDDDFIVPDHCNSDIISYLISVNVQIEDYSYIFVRNISHILQSVLKYRDKYKYRVGFRTSFAKSTQAYESAKLNNSGIFKSVLIKYGNWRKDKLINQVDLFIPTSNKMKEVFYPKIDAKTFILPTAIDPKKIENIPTRDDNIYKFIYVGTLDKLREFDVVLEAFNKLQKDNWSLTIIVYNPELISTIIKSYPNIQNKIHIIDTDVISEMHEYILKSDVGLAILPDKKLYNSALASKVVDYYAYSLPTLLTNNSKNSSLFENNSEAFLVDFDSDAISLKLNELISIDKNRLIEIGNNGLKRLIDNGRDYDTLAKELYNELESL